MGHKSGLALVVQAFPKSVKKTETQTFESVDAFIKFKVANPGYKDEVVLGHALLYEVGRHAIVVMDKFSPKDDDGEGIKRLTVYKLAKGSAGWKQAGHVNFSGKASATFILFQAAWLMNIDPDAQIEALSRCLTILPAERRKELVKTVLKEVDNVDLEW